MKIDKSKIETPEEAYNFLRRRFGKNSVKELEELIGKSDFWNSATDMGIGILLVDGKPGDIIFQKLLLDDKMDYNPENPREQFLYFVENYL